MEIAVQKNPLKKQNLKLKDQDQDQDQEDKLNSLYFNNSFKVK